MAPRSRALPAYGALSTPLIVSLCLFFGVPGAYAGAPSLLILGAASLTDALPRVVGEWKRSHPDVDVKLSFDGSSRLAAQVEEGAPADIFISADSAWMDYLQKSAKVDATTRRELLGNEIVLIVPNGKSAPSSVQDLEEPVYKKIALSGENVPISRYAQTAFENLGIWTLLQPKIVRGENVRTHLKWVEEGEVDAGIVYRTDAIGDSKVKVAFVFPSESYPPVVYPGAVISTSRSKRLAADFLDFCGRKAAQAIFRRMGFTAPRRDGRK